ncbi:MAG TPA: SCO family protein [Bacteroidales bacterium]|nr:SCO family protein [Bacteroidales bacterium]
MLLTSCREDPEEKSKACCSKETAEKVPGERSGESLFHLDQEWTTQRGKTLRLEQFRDRIVVAAMIFTHCESACPRIVSDMKRIEASLSEEELRKVCFLLLSMDPERDSPARMNAFALEHGLGPDWTLMRSSASSTMEMANVLGVRVQKLEDGGFDHSNVIHILDGEGVIRYQHHGFSEDTEPLVLAVREFLDSE